MILVDTSVWIDLLRDSPTWHVDRLGEALRDENVVMGDLILAEVLQGARGEHEARGILARIKPLDVIPVCDHDVAIKAAANYRQLRSKGVTVRSLVDTLVATRCMEDGLMLLHNDRDYDPFERELGLQVVRPVTH